MQNQWAEILIVGTSLFLFVFVMTRPLGVRVSANWPGEGLNYSFLLFGFNLKLKKNQGVARDNKAQKKKSKNDTSKNDKIRTSWWFDAGVRSYLLSFALKTLISLIKLPSLQLEKLHWKLGLEEPEVLGTICASMAMVRGVPGGERVVFEPDFEKQTIALYFRIKGFIRLYAIGFFILQTIIRFPWWRSAVSWVRTRKKRKTDIKSRQRT